MQYISYYKSTFGNILLAADDIGLIGLWFENQKYFKAGLSTYKVEETEIIKKAKMWLDIYFKGLNPNFNVPLHLIGTEFQIEVWKILNTIPYGKTITYKQIANIVVQKRNIKSMSCQAVGMAVGKNKISIIVPCHRVIGSNGSLTGYAGGIDIKEKLLKLEGFDKNKFIC